MLVFPPSLDLECGSFQPQSCRLFDTEHQVHVLYCLPDGSFQEVVDGGGDKYLSVEAINMHQCLVGVHHLFQVNGLVAVMGKGGIFVKVFVGFNDVLCRCLCLDDGSAENATGEITAIGDEVDSGIQITLYLFQTLADLGDVLVRKGFVDAQVVVAPREMGGGTRLSVRHRWNR